MTTAERVAKAEATLTGALEKSRELPEHEAVLWIYDASIAAAKVLKPVRDQLLRP